MAALKAEGALNNGQANSLLVNLNLKGNNGNIGKVQSFLNQVAAHLNAGILTPEEAEALLYWGNILLQSVSQQ